MVSLTFRALAGRRRVLLISLLGALPLVIAVLIRASGRATHLDTVTTTILDRLVISTIVPLVALVFGTSALGAELDDGTAIYLIAKPVARWRIIAAKVIVAAGLSVLVTAPAAFLAAVVLGAGGLGAAVGWGVGTAVAAALYAIAFLALSLLTGRAVAIGLIYILVWEGLLAGLLPGTRTFSIRQYALGIADALGGGGLSEIDERLAGTTAVVLAIVVAFVALAIAVRRLQTWEIGEAD